MKTQSFNEIENLTKEYSMIPMINGLYKVQAGAYTDRKNAEKTEKKLKKL